MDVKNGLQMATRNVPRDNPGVQDCILFAEVNDNGCDFLMTAQGGLKGKNIIKKRRPPWHCDMDSICFPRVFDLSPKKF